MRSVVVDDGDVVCVTFVPRETEAPLVVDADTELPLSVAMELFEAIAGRNPEIVDIRGVIEHA